MLRFLTAGESHGKGLSAIIEGFPAGLPLAEDDINVMLSRRQHSYGRGTRMKIIEKDRINIVGGVRNGVTLGSPVALYLENDDYQYRKNRQPRVRHVPRPGHADLAGVTKYRFDDIHNVIERASARETAIRTAVGAVAKCLLSEFEIEILGHVIRIGRQKARRSALNQRNLRQAIHTSPVFCADERTAQAMCKEIDQAKADGDTLGGMFEVWVINPPVGLGSYVHWDRKLDGRLAQAIMSIPSVKGVEIGNATENARRRGSKAHDVLHAKQGTITRRTNQAGGLEGGVTNGETIIIRGSAKPISSLRDPLPSVNLKSKTATRAPYVRSDVCVVPAISVIAEAMVAWVIAECIVEKYGGDSLSEMKDNFSRSQEHDIQW